MITREIHRESPRRTPLQPSKGHTIGNLKALSTLYADNQTRKNENRMRTKHQ